MRIKRNHLLIILLVLPFFLFMANEEEAHASGSKEFIGKVINFAVLFGGLTFLLHKPVKKFLEGRSREVDQAMKQASGDRKTAEENLLQAKKRMEGLSREVGEIREEGESIGKREQAEIIAAAQKEAGRIRHYAEQEAEMLTRVGIRDLRVYTADLACASALESIRKKMTPELHSDLIDKSIEKLESLYEKSSTG